MMTIRDVMRPPHDLLRHVPQTPRRETTVIDNAVITDAQWQLTETHEGTALAVIPAEGAEIDTEAIPEAMCRLMANGVTAIALSAGIDRWPDHVTRAATRANLPLMTPAEGGTLPASRIREHIISLQLAIYRAQKAQTSRLNQIARQVDSDPRSGPARLVEWLARELEREDATAALITPSEAPEILAGNEKAQQTYRRMRDRGSPPTEHIPGEPHVALNVTSSKTPFKVLAVVSRWELTPHLLDLARDTALHITYAERAASDRRIKAGELSLRIAIMQQLLTGEVASAQRSAAQLPTGQLRGTAGRMAVLECAAPQDRDAAVAAAEAATGGQALVGPCPGRERDVLMIIPEQTARCDRRVREMLAPLVTADHGAALGISTVLPYYATAYNYVAATGALATARSAPDHISVHRGGTTLGAELPPEPFAAWGQSARLRLAAIPAEYRDSVVHTTVIALASGHQQTADLLRISKSTVGRYVRDVMRALGLDCAQYTHRAVAQLILQAPLTPAPASTPVPTLAELLDDEGPRRWAEEVLRPLQGQPEALRLLITWLRCGAKQQAAAAEFGIGRNTVSARLEAIAAALSLPLLDPGGGLHEPLWALSILGRLDMPLPDPATALHVH